MSRARIAFIGAGSTVFAKTLMGDVLSRSELADVTLALHDIDPERLAASEVVARKVAAATGTAPTILATTDRGHALDGADYVITLMQVGGYEPATVVDFEVPKRHGLRQTIGDTLGIGGIMRALRTIPVLLDVASDMERLCPDATLLQFVNPMAMNCWALSRASSVATVGLCHSVQATAGKLARDLGVPVEEVDYLVAGINHMAFYLKLERHGDDLYPALRRVLDEGRAPSWNLTRYELLRRFSYFVTESSEHLAEYVPWFIKRDRPDLVERFHIPLDEYPRRCVAQIEEWERMARELVDERVPLEVVPSFEYAADIIHSMETGTPSVVYGNVPNHGLIDNLPAGCSVEVPCLVDRQGVQPTRVGALPPQLAALIQTNVNVQSLTVEAALTGKREHVYQAAMLDPHTAAELDLDQIVALVDDLIEAHGAWLPPLA
jgi:alpha-galactosidase